MKKNHCPSLAPGVLCVILMLVLPGAERAVFSQAERLSKEVLIAGKWGPEFRAGIDITFKKDGRFDAKIDYGQDYDDIKGTYTIDGDRLSLLIDGEKSGSTLVGKSLRDGVMITDPRSPKYRKYLSFRNGSGLNLSGEVKIWDRNSLVAPDTEMMIGKTHAVIMGAREAVTTTNVKMREMPSTNAKEFQYQYEDAMDTIVVKFLKPDTRLIVLARTKSKDRVQSWENYWYYVEFERYIDPLRVWVYGEFIKFKK